MTQPKFTTEQTAAIATRDVSVGLAAGAGCGKTFVLTERFLAELEPAANLDPPDLSSIVAITFTDAAARELRDRIRSKCREKLERAPSEQRDYWRVLSRSIDTARISTIHAYCGSVLRQFAFDLGLDPGFAVLEAGNARSLENSVFNDWLRQQLTDSGESLLLVLEAWGLDGLQSRMRSMLANWRDDLAPQWLDKTPQQIILEWQRVHEELVASELLPALLASSALQTIRTLYTLAEPKNAKHTDQQSRISEQLSVSPSEIGIDIWLAELKPLLALTGGLFHRSRWPDPETYQQFKQAVDNFREESKSINPPDWEANEVFRAAELGLHLLQLTLNFRQTYQRAKTEHNALDFDDLLDLMHRFVTEGQFSRLVKQLREGIHVLMVDEFQDTDFRQVAILRQLVGDELNSGKLFFVGDSKQSIYRFRGAEPAVFDQLRVDLPAKGQLPLSMNFRSQPAILQFVNTLFSNIFEDYQSLTPHRDQKTPPPAIEFLWAQYPDEKDKSWPVDRQRQHEASAIASRIRDMLDSNAKLVGCEVSAEHSDGLRPVEQGDIAILFRALSDVRFYEDALRTAGVDYYLVGGRAFYAQQEVFDVLHLLRCVASECDNLSLAGALRSPWFSLADETLIALAIRDGELSPVALTKPPPKELPQPEIDKLIRAQQVIAKLRDRKDMLPPAELLELAIELTGYDATQLAEFMGERKLANLEKLIEMARSASAAGVGSLDEFVNQLADFIGDPPREPPASTSGAADNVVRLMTVHQSKGLEFPVVFVADVGRKKQSDHQPAVLDSQLGPVVSLGDEVGDSKHNAAAQIRRQRENKASLAELNRHFYVACTRAADYLVLSGALSTFDGTGGPWIETLSAAFDIDTGHACDGEMQVQVTKVDPREQKPTESTRRELGKSLEYARTKRDAITDPVAPIPRDVSSAKQFSVTRLNGHLVSAMPTWQNDSDRRSDALDPLGFGTLVHAVLERIDFSKPDGAKLWADRIAPFHELEHAKQAAVEATELVEAFCASTTGQDIAKSREQRRELEFLFPWDHPHSGQPLQLRGYIDLLYRDDAGKLWVLDYKTNQIPVELVSQVAEQYELQMHLYALVVETVMGESPAGMRLAFLRPGPIHQFTWDDAARERARQLVDQAVAHALEPVANDST